MRRKLYTLCIILLGCTCIAQAQNWDSQRKRIVWELGGHREPRLTLKLIGTSINIGGYQEFSLIVKNNFSAKLWVHIEVTLTDFCGTSKTQTIKRTLEGNQTIGGDTWSGGDEQWGFGSSCKQVTELAKGDRSRISQMSYEIVEVKDLDAERKKEEEARLAAERKRAEELEKQKQEAAQKQKEAEEKRKKEAEELKKKEAEEQKKKEAEAQKKKEAEAKEKQTAAAKTTDGSSTSSSNSSSTETSSSTTAPAKTSQQLRQEQLAEQRAAAEEQKRLEQERKEEEARKEQERLQQRQQQYDSWLSNKKQEQKEMETKSAESSAMLLFLVGNWIYGKMGAPNANYVFQTFHNRAQFYTGIEYGYSVTSFPMIFQSHYHTMVGGRDVYTKELEKVNAYTVNLDVKFKLGADHAKYGGGYAYISPKAGFSPIFDAYNVAPMVYGAHLHGGWKWVQAYVDYSEGTRTFTKTSNDPEESGEGRSVFGFTKMQYGIQFITNPNADFKRSHIRLGIISEKLKPNREGGVYADPQTNSFGGWKESPLIKGYAFEWKKDNTFNFYINAYPEYLYTGETGGLSSSKEFNSTKTGVFVEAGFIRSVDWWFNK